MSTHNADPPIDEGADWEAIARCLAGESSPDERRRVESWVAEMPGRSELLAALDSMLHPAAVAPLASVDVERALADVRARLHEAHPIPLASRRREPATLSRRWSSTALRVAALVAVLVGGLLLFGRLDRGPAPASVAAAGMEFATAVGERESLALVDGTAVVLAPESRLTLAPGYGTSHRDIALAGEAMFDVPHDDVLPFRVWTAAGTVVDLGTAFSVRSTPGTPLRVIVTQGSVLLQRPQADAGEGLVLRAGDVGTLAPGAEPLADRGAATPDDVAWTRGVIVLRDAPISQVAAELRRWYGVDLGVADPALARRHLTATFADDSPAQIARVIALALGAEATVRGDSILIDMPSAPR